MLTKIIDGLSNKLADQWMATLLTPAFVFWGGGLLAWAWRFGWAPLEKWFVALSLIVQVIVLISALLLVIVSAVVVQRFDLLVLRMLEGYWPRWLQRPRTCRINQIKAKYNQKFLRLQDLAGKGLEKLSPDELLEYAELDEYITRRMPANPVSFMPTRIGNILRAAELHSKDKYGLEAIVCWPLLWLLLPDSARKELTDARAILNTTVRLFSWSILFLIWLIWGAWWILPISILIALYAYRWVINAAETYGDLLEASFDLYRSLLYQSLRWPMPRNPMEERQTGKQVTDYLLRGSESPTPTFNI